MGQNCRRYRDRAGLFGHLGLLHGEGQRRVGGRPVHRRLCHPGLADRYRDLIFARSALTPRYRFRASSGSLAIFAAIHCGLVTDGRLL
jgi:hypothetical protein